YSNFKRRTEYPFLIWDGSETQDVPEAIPNLIPYNPSSLENSAEEGAKDINRRQEIESKIALLNRLVGHLNTELTSNNLQHVEAIINNLGHAFTVITDIETAQNRRQRIPTWRGSKPWTLFLS
ncbi:10300_t:CDS:1, partial [Cetraspora pellucida]